MKKIIITISATLVLGLSVFAATQVSQEDCCAKQESCCTVGASCCTK